MKRERAPEAHLQGWLGARSPHRRFVVLGMLATSAMLPLAMASCSSDAAVAAAEDAAPVDTRPPTPADYDRPVTRPDEGAAAKDREACKFARGALPDETLGAQVPMGKDIPIETIVILMQENRSFDHYFGHFNQYTGKSDVLQAPADAQNPDRAGQPGGAHQWLRAEHMCFLDTNHEWDGSHHQYNDGKNDGFYETNHDFAGEIMPNPTKPQRNGERAMRWFDQKEIPFYYALAKEFALGDHYFCSLLGPTWPNRMFLFAATSFGQTENFFPDISKSPFPQTDVVVLDELDKRHVDWKLYTAGGPPGVTTVVSLELPKRWNREVVFSMEDFYRDAKDGKLPPVVYLDANFLRTGDPEGETEHPPSDMQVGQKFVWDITKALFTSPQWSKMAFFMMYDEHGGLFDHVAPPKACVPDQSPVVDKEHKPVPGAFDRYGFRVPFLVVSPYAKKGFVTHQVYDHASVLRFVQAKHRLPALTARDANANIPYDMFDFQNPPNLVPPSFPEPQVDPAELEYCRANFKR